MEEINLSYLQYEEELKQIMIEYEIAVGTEDATGEEAMTDYENKLRSAFEVHGNSSEENKEAVISKLIEIADEYAEIGMAFQKAEEIQLEPAIESDISEQTEGSVAEVDSTPTEYSETKESAENNTKEA